MPIAIVTSKGRVTIPKAVRDIMHVDCGDEIEFVVAERGDVVIRNVRLDIRELRGILKRRRQHSVSVEEMNEAVARQHVKAHVERMPGRLRGRVLIAPDFDAPLPGYLFDSEE
jgi:antitoxin PrlF